MDITQFPRRHYTENVTPLQYLENFSKELNGPNVYMKRDDLLGLTAGGNKTRKLEFLMADAVEKGADTIITSGATQSNHCRLTLAAAVKEGLKCILVLEEVIPNSYHAKASGNILIYHLLGAEIIVVPKGTNKVAEMEKVAANVREKGGVPYTIPVGGSNEIGAMGYTVCATEILQQSKEMDLDLDYIVVPNGSVGTHAGLLLGLFGSGCNIPVLGINVSRDKESATQLTYDLIVKTAKKLGIEEKIPKDIVHCYDQYLGPGYALPTDEMIESVQMLAKTEGILLDPVYTGKVMSGLVDFSRNGTFKKDDNVLFIHTGGLPSLFANIDVVLEEKR